MAKQIEPPEGLWYGLTDMVVTRSGRVYMGDILVTDNLGVAVYVVIPTSDIVTICRNVPVLERVEDV